MGNNVLPQPPLQVPLTDSKTNLMNNAWKLWFDQIHYNITPVRNSQAITAATTINLDASYVSISNTSGANYTIILPAPTAPSRPMMIEMNTGSNTNYVTLAQTNITNTTGGGTTSIKFNGSNQQIFLTSANSKWIMTNKNGVTLS